MTQLDYLIGFVYYLSLPKFAFMIYEPKRSSCFHLTYLVINSKMSSLTYFFNLKHYKP